MARAGASLLKTWALNRVPENFTQLKDDDSGMIALAKGKKGKGNKR